MPVAHRADHRDLLRPVGNGRRRAVDVVVVPTSRPADHLCSAAELAEQLGSLLVVLSSGGGPGQEDIASIMARWPHLRWESLRVPALYEHVLLRMATIRSVDDNLHGLLGLKRSVGILLGRLLRHRTILFLDDDIIGVDPTSVTRAAAGLGDLAAVGFAVADSPDNSVVCHANRLGGGEQAVFVSGSALLVDLDRPVGFFPAVYNEDWVFMADALRSGGVGRLGRVGQTSRESPFGDPSRARREEFGEIVAEGLMEALHRRVPMHALLETPFWTAFSDSRRAFIEEARRRLEARPVTVERAAALASLAAAEDRRREISPSTCAAYIQDWRSDLAVWHQQLDALPRLWTFGQAASFLGLSTQDRRTAAGGSGRDRT